MKWKGRPILKMRVPASGVTVEAPEYEWRSVAREYHFTFDQFTALSIDEQASHIAHYRVSKQIEAVLSNDSVNRQREAARKARSKGKGK